MGETVFVGSGSVEFIGPARRHIYKRGRTQCGNRTYKTGFAPCELALPEGAMAPLEGYHGDPLCIAKVEFDSGRKVNDLHRPRGTQQCNKPKDHKWHVINGIYRHNYKAGAKLTDEDMQAAADLLGLSVCHYLTDDERRAYEETLRASADPRQDGYLIGDIIERAVSKELRTDLPHLDPLWRSIAEEKTP